MHKTDNSKQALWVPEGQNISGHDLKHSRIQTSSASCSGDNFLDLRASRDPLLSELNVSALLDHAVSQTTLHLIQTGDIKGSRQKQAQKVVKNVGHRIAKLLEAENGIQPTLAPLLCEFSKSVIALLEGLQSSSDQTRNEVQALLDLLPEFGLLAVQKPNDLTCAGMIALVICSNLRTSKHPEVDCLFLKENLQLVTGLARGAQNLKGRSANALPNSSVKTFIKEADILSARLLLRALFHPHPVPQEFFLQDLQQELNQLARTFQDHSSKAETLSLASVPLRLLEVDKERRVKAVKPVLATNSTSFEHGNPKSGIFRTQFVFGPFDSKEFKPYRKMKGFFENLQDSGAIGRNVEVLPAALKTEYIREGSSTRSLIDLVLQSEYGVSAVSSRQVGGVFDAPINEVHYVTGPCLFSAHSAFGITPEGDRISLTNRHHTLDQPIISLSVDSDISVYELDMVKRSSDLIQSLSSGVDGTNRLHLLIPDSEYILYLFEAAEHDLVSDSILREWGELVHARRALLGNAISKRLEGTNIECSVLDALTPLKPLIADVLAGRRAIDQALKHEFLSTLCASSQSWCQLAEAFELDATQLHWNDFGLYGYGVAYSSVSRVDGPNDNPQRLVIGVENHEEEKIFVRVGEIIQKAKINMRLAAFLSRPLLALKEEDGSAGFSNLYYEDIRVSKDLKRELDPNGYLHI